MSSSCFKPIWNSYLVYQVHILVIIHHGSAQFSQRAGWSSRPWIIQKLSKCVPAAPGFRPLLPMPALLEHKQCERSCLGWRSAHQYQLLLLRPMCYYGWLQALSSLRSLELNSQNPHSQVVCIVQIPCTTDKPSAGPPGEKLIPHHSIFSSKTWAHTRTPKEVAPRE